jgi:hypothetical protein
MSTEGLIDFMNSFPVVDAHEHLPPEVIIYPAVLVYPLRYEVLSLVLQFTDKSK